MVTTLLETAAARDPYLLLLSAPAYRVVWFLVVLFHTLMASLLARALYSLVRTLRHPLLVINVIGATGVVFHTSVVYMSIGCGLVVIAISSFELVRISRLTLRARRLTLVPYELQRPPGAPVKLVSLRTGSLRTACRSIAYRLHHFRWVISTRGPYFQETYHLREAIEIAMQTAQAFRLSFAVSHDWTNQLSAGVIVLNCWSSPLLYWIFSKSAVKRRLSCLAVDVVLDFTSSLVIPYTIYAKYRAMLPLLDMFDPIWVHQASNDLQQFTNFSLFDVTFRMASAASLLLSLQTIQALVRRKPAPRGVASAASIAPSPSLVSATSGLSACPPKPTHERRHARWLALTHLLFVAYGFAVLTVFGLASTRWDHRTALPGCQFATRQWLAKQYPCAVLEINCHARQLQGTHDELTLALADVDALSLSSLVFSHCPRLSVPPAILRFPNLVWLELYNSTLLDWPAAARPSPSTSRHLSRVLLIQVAVATPSFPAGLLPPSASAYPPALSQIVVVATNLSAFPADLKSHWDPRRLTSLILEDCQLAQVPPALDGFRLTSLSLAANALQELPAWLLFRGAGLQYAQFSVAGNPLASLPTGSRGADDAPFAPLRGMRRAFQGVFLDHTALARLPPWASAAGLCARVDVSAVGSPLCADGGDLRTRASCVADATHCAPPPEDAGGRLFPLSRHEARRRVDESW